MKAGTVCTVVIEWDLDTYYESYSWCQKENLLCAYRYLSIHRTLRHLDGKTIYITGPFELFLAPKK